MKKFLFLISLLLVGTFALSGCSKEKLPDSGETHEQEQTAIVRENNEEDPDCELKPQLPFNGLIIGMLILPRPLPPCDSEEKESPCESDTEEPDAQKPSPRLKRRDGSHRSTPRSPRIGKVKPQVQTR